MVYDIRVCKQCGIEFERTVKAAQIYCTKECRRLANADKDKAIIRKWHITNPISGMLRTLRHRAKHKGLDFNLTKNDLVVPECCPVFGFRLVQSIGAGNGGKYNSPSVDRIDNSKGYVVGNVQVMSQLANAMKSDATPEQLLQFAHWVLKTYGDIFNESKT